MKTILKPLYLIWKIYFLLVFLVAFLTLLIPYLIIFNFGKRPFKFAFQMMRFHSKFIALFTGTWFITKGREHIPDGPVIICSNHSSYTDIVYTYCIIPKYFVFLGKKELGNVPLFKVFFKKMNILVDRKNKVAAKKSIEKCAERISEGESIIIFPEGTIPESAPKMIAFKNGAFGLAIETQTPILPITYIDNHKRLAQGSWFAAASPGRARVIIHEAIDTKGMTSEDLLSLKEKVRTTIEAPLNQSL